MATLRSSSEVHRLPEATMFVLGRLGYRTPMCRTDLGRGLATKPRSRSGQLFELNEYTVCVLAQSLSLLSFRKAAHPKPRTGTWLKSDVRNLSHWQTNFFRL
jgi:hypothetical protein